MTAVLKKRHSLTDSIRHSIILEHAEKDDFDDAVLRLKDEKTARRMSLRPSRSIDQLSMDFNRFNTISGQNDTKLSTTRTTSLLQRRSNMEFTSENPKHAHRSLKATIKKTKTSLPAFFRDSSDEDGSSESELSFIEYTTKEIFETAKTGDLDLLKTQKALGDLRFENIRDWCSWSLAHVCARYNQPAVLTYVLSQCPSLAFSVDGEGWTPLHHAVYENNQECQEVLYNFNVNPSALNKRNETPFSLLKL